MRIITHFSSQSYKKIFKLFWKIKKKKIEERHINFEQKYNEKLEDLKKQIKDLKENNFPEEILIENNLPEENVDGGAGSSRDLRAKTSEERGGRKNKEFGQRMLESKKVHRPS